MPRVNEIYCYSKSPFKPDIAGGNNFIVYSSNRTGSTLLGTLLNSHPGISHKGELFLKFTKCFYKKVHFPYAYIKGSQSADSDYFSFEIKTQHLNHIFFNKDKEIIQNLFRKNWKVIYLHRHNIFRQALSHLIAMQTDQWHNFSNSNFKPRKVYIDSVKLMETIKWFEKLRTIERKNLEKVEYLEIIYENDLLHKRNHQGTCEKVFNYIGIKSNQVSTSIKRISSDNLSDQIINYKELEKYFSITEYSQYLSKQT